VKIHATLLKWSLMVVLFPMLSYVTASAQTMFSTNPYNNPLNNMLTTMINGKINEEMLKQSVVNRPSGGDNGSRSNAPSTTPQSRKSPAEINRIASFRPTPAPIKVRELANMIASTPEEREQTFTVFSNLLTYYEGEAKRLGKPDDFSLALSFFLAVNSSLFHGTPPPDDAHLMRLRDIIAESMAEDPQFAHVTDRSKQELYETMVVFTLFAQASYNEAKQAGNQALADGYRKFAGINLQNFCKTPPDRLNF
jgi:hypothetical protein